MGMYPIAEIVIGVEIDFSSLEYAYEEKNNEKLIHLYELCVDNKVELFTICEEESIIGISLLNTDYEPVEFKDDLFKDIDKKEKIIREFFDKQFGLVVKPYKILYGDYR